MNDGGLWRWRYGALAALGILCGVIGYVEIGFRRDTNTSTTGNKNVEGAASREAAPEASGGEGGEWASFRGDAARTGVAESRLPERLRKIWRYEAGEAVSSTAAIVGDRVYVGTEGGRLVAVRLGDGTQVWEFKAEGAILASACAEGGRVFVGDDTGKFYAVDAGTGKKLWEIETGDKVASSAVAWGDAGTPNRDPSRLGALLVGSYDQRLLCLNVADGKERWAFTTEAQVHCSPAIWEGPKGVGVVIAGCDSTLRVIDFASGEQRMAVDVGEACAATPAVFWGHAYFGNLGGDFFSVDLARGTVDWKIAGENKEHPLAKIMASAAVTKDAVFFTTENRKLLRVGRAKGNVEWEFRARQAIDSSPVVVGGGAGRVFFGADDGCVYGVSADKGRPVWKFVVGGQVKASPAVGEGRMVIGTSNGGVWCFGE